MPKNEIDDLGDKIRFLLRRGDPHRRRFVNRQASLASALGISPPTLSRIIKGKAPLPDDTLESLCELCGVDQAMFRTSSGSEFISYYKASAPKPSAQVDWRIMVRMASGERGRLWPHNPAKLRYPKLEAETCRQVPTIEIHKLFSVEFDGDMHPNGKVSLWTGWHLMWFCQGSGSNGFKCYIPAYRRSPGYDVELFPNSLRVMVPNRRGVGIDYLSHDEEDLGKTFTWVLVASKEAFPASIREPFLDTEAQDLGLERGLDQLAIWLAAQPSATTSIIKFSYQVVSNQKKQA